MSMMCMAKRPMSNEKTHQFCIAACALICSNSALSSPWLEANDPFLRSSLVLLSDAEQLSSPIGHYPLRWSMFADDINDVGSSNESVILASRELLYMMNSAKLNRGNQSFKVLGASNAILPSGFGDVNEDEKGVYTSVEHLDNAFSSRLSVGYREYQNERDFDIDNSYLAFNSGGWLWSVSNINRWWGQGWQHTLILGSYAKVAPDISASYMGESDLLGVWSLESLLAQPSHDHYDYHSATRFVAKPWSRFEYGVTYQAWLSDDGANKGSSQFALDAKLTLPVIDNLYHSVYTETVSTSRSTELGAWLLGWTGSFLLGDNTARIVVESQHTNRHYGGWGYPSVTDGVSNTTYLLDDSLSFALYLQRMNDHQLGLSYQKSTLDNDRTTASKLTYRLPALSGRVGFGTGFVTSERDTNKRNIWVDYEFRF